LTWVEAPHGGYDLLTSTGSSRAKHIVVRRCFFLCFGLWMLEFLIVEVNTRFLAESYRFCHQDSFRITRE